MGRPPGVGLLAELRHRGVVIVSGGTKVRVKSKGGLTPGLREALTTHKADLLAALSLEDRLLQMPLGQFEREGRPIQFKVPGFQETLWFVPGCPEREDLTAKGVGRGRIWTVRELMEIWKVPELTREQAQTLARVKIEFEAEVVSVEPLTAEGELNRGEK